MKKILLLLALVITTAVSAQKTETVEQFNDKQVQEYIKQTTGSKWMGAIGTAAAVVGGVVLPELVIAGAGLSLVALVFDIDAGKFGKRMKIKKKLKVYEMMEIEKIFQQSDSYKTFLIENEGRGKWSRQQRYNAAFYKWDKERSKELRRERRLEKKSGKEN